MTRLEVLDLLDGPQGEVTCVAFSPDGEWLAAVSLGDLFLWPPNRADVRVLDPIAEGLNGQGSLGGFAFSPDAQLVAVTRLHSTGPLLMNVVYGTGIGRLDDGDQSVVRTNFRPVFSRDGTAVANGAGQGIILIRDCRRGDLVRQLSVGAAGRSDSRSGVTGCLRQMARTSDCGSSTGILASYSESWNVAATLPKKSDSARTAAASRRLR